MIIFRGDIEQNHTGCELMATENRTGAHDRDVWFIMQGTTLYNCASTSMITYGIISHLRFAPMDSSLKIAEVKLIVDVNLSKYLVLSSRQN